MTNYRPLTVRLPGLSHRTRPRVCIVLAQAGSISLRVGLVVGQGCSRGGHPGCSLEALDGPDDVFLHDVFCRLRVAGTDGLDDQSVIVQPIMRSE